MLYIDNRVGSKELADHIPKTTPHTLSRLDYGDVSFLGHGADGMWSIGVERKKVGDLVNSIDTGRLSGHQLLGLLSCYNRVILIVEGLWRPHPDNGILQAWKRGKWQDLQHGNRRWMAREVNNYLHSLAMVCGVVTVHTTNIGETAAYLTGIYHWWQKEWHQHRAHLQFYSHSQCTQVELFRPGIVARVAKEISGVGWDRAKALAARYGSVIDLVMADEKELRQVEGIGKKLARTILEELRGGGDDLHHG